MWYDIFALNKSFNKSYVKFVLLITKSVSLYKRNDQFNNTIVKRKYTYRAIISDTS